MLNLVLFFISIFLGMAFCGALIMLPKFRGIVIVSLLIPFIVLNQICTSLFPQNVKRSRFPS